MTKNVNGEKMLGFVKTLTITIASLILVTLLLSSKSIWIQNLVITNHGYLHCAVLKALYNFKVKRVHEARDNQSFFQNVQDEISEIFEMFKNNLKFTTAACWINSKISSRENSTTLMK